MLTPRAKRAIARRVLLVAGVILAIVFTFWQRAVLYRVGVEDFAERQRQEYAWTGRRGMSLDDYIRFRTEEHLIRKDSQAWHNLHRDLAVREEDSFFLPGQTPLDELAGHLNGPYAYVALEREGDMVYLEVVESRPDSMLRGPSRLRYPLRRFAMGVFLAGLLGYLLIPWPKPDPNVVAYARFIGALLPDLGVGLLFVGPFFTMPWLIVPPQAGTSHPLVVEGGWIILTLIMWGFVFFGLAVHVVAAWYEALNIQVASDHLLIDSLVGIERVPFTEIERVTFGVKQPPKALVKIGLLVSLFNWRAAGPTLLMASRDNPVLCLVKRDGRTRTFSLCALLHVPRLIAALKEAQIPVDPELESLEQ